MRHAEVVTDISLAICALVVLQAKNAKRWLQNDFAAENGFGMWPDGSDGNPHCVEHKDERRGDTMGDDAFDKIVNLFTMVSLHLHKDLLYLFLAILPLNKNV